jgi:hypothetical protein
MVELQRDCKILPVGVAQTGSWRYSFVYEMVHRYYPDLPEQARLITRTMAREKLMTLYFNAVGAATAADARRLFQWKRKEVDNTLNKMVEFGHLHPGYSVAGHTGEHYVFSRLLA